MEEIELTGKRGPREKHFLQKDGTIIAKMYDTDIHYLKDGKYEEIDNTLVRENDCLVNKSNDYKVEFKDNFKDSLMKMTKDNYYIDFKLKNLRDSIIQPQKRLLSKKRKNITYSNITDDITVEYQTLANKVKETIVLQNSNHSELNFELDTNLILNIVDGEIIAKDKNDNIIFRIEKPFMIDSNNIRNDKVYYEINYYEDGYVLKLLLDDEWLNEDDRKYPVYVDPTITNYKNSNSVSDTYICNADNSSKGSESILKAGVERVNGIDKINRSLLKFDLPDIGTGSEVIDAEVVLISCLSSTNSESSSEPLVELHRVTADWDENTANWSNMNDKFDSRVEAIYPFSRSTLNGNTIMPSMVGLVITELVKRWYRDLPNYGVMVKSVNEKYIDDDYPAFYSKNNQINGDPKPILTIQYINQNGLEDYLNYKQQVFTSGSTYVNTYNGNLVGVFNIGHTIGGAFPANVKLIYNTNDVILNKISSFGKGFMLNLEQTIKITIIDDNEYLEYVDEDGTIHYFVSKNFLYPLQKYDENIYVDEDGLGYEIVKKDDICTMNDKNGKTMLFSKISGVYYLTKITDANGNDIIIEFDSNNRISKIKDFNNSEILFTYNSSSITVKNPDFTTILSISDNVVNSIETCDGTTVFTYSNGLISSITDVNGSKMQYDYYNKKPYKVKKVTQYGLKNTLGQYFTLNYGNERTTIIDNKNRSETLLFNSQGNLLSINSLGDSDNISEAYSIMNEYGDGLNGMDQNKIISFSSPTRYVKNYLKNTSFEDTQDYFTTDSDNGIFSKEITSTEANSGNKSLKVTTNAENQYIYQNVLIPKGNYYTFSGYFKNQNDIIISLNYVDENGDNVTSVQKIDSSDEFVRNDVTIYYDLNATSDLMIKITSPSANVFYVDDIQLEEGEVSNGYNVIENSDFANGYDDWNPKVYNENNEEVDSKSFYELIKLNDGKNNALKVKMNPLYTTRFRKKFSIKGKTDDLYTISFWYKNEGVVQCRPHTGNSVTIYFHPADGEAEYCIVGKELNIDAESWQYFSYRGRALEDFDYIEVIFNQSMNANNFYITNISFYRETTSGDYAYDDNGNLISAKDQSKSDSKFTYDKKNQLISATTPKGSNFKFEYDKEKTDRILSAISSTGISNEIKYNSLGNPVITRTEKKYIKNIKDGIYRIRSQGTDKYIKARYRDILVESNPCSNTLWKLEKDQNENFKIIYSVLPTYSISYSNDVVRLTGLDENNLFILEGNDDGSYYIKLKYDNDRDSKYLRVGDTGLEITSLDVSDSNFKFYIELANRSFLESSATYSEDNRFVTSITDTNLRKTSFENDTITGLLTKIIAPNNQTTEYTYNERKQLISVTIGDRVVSYDYNNNMISKISKGNIVYNFNYDDFMNLKSVYIGDSIKLIENEYEENNGNIISSVYGNNQKISFNHDAFDRLSEIHRMDNDYYYKYDNNGNLSKISDGNNIIKYYYDLCNRLYRYIDGVFKINYTYDNNNNVKLKKYIMSDNEHTVENVFDEDDGITKVLFDDKEINYQYDDLGRLSTKILPNNSKISYNYFSNGKRATNLISCLKTDKNEFNYTYDESNNITSICYNEKSANNYYYDKYNQLIKEENFNTGEITENNYDGYGNLLTRIVKSMDTGDIVRTDTYQYDNEGWSDLLTKFNDDSISYDEIGNPVNIGDNVVLDWINGRLLKSYTDHSRSKNITYKYNVNNIRDSKIVNGMETKYYIEDDKIIYEKRENDKYIYYLYDTTGLIGFEYCNNLYYYEKNLQGDIIGILDSDSNLLVSYSYDSWGNLLSIKDINNCDISDENNIGFINPFRYRGYYYDSETDLYYLNSRYYNPKWGRFINTDSTICSNSDIISNNLFSYASNNPINYTDDNGNSWKSLLKKVIKKTKIYKVIKTVITVASNIYLGLKGYSVSKNMFNKSMYNPSGNISKKTQNQIKKKSQNSPQVTGAINSCISQNSGNNSFSNCLGYDDAEMQGDLYYSIQHVDIIVSGTKINQNTWDINISMSDKYDFAKRDGSGFNVAVNNLGYVMQEIGMLTPYDWTISYNVKYTEQN